MNYNSQCGQPRPFKQPNKIHSNIPSQEWEFLLSGSPSFSHTTPQQRLILPSSIHYGRFQCLLLTSGLFQDASKFCECFLKCTQNYLHQPWSPFKISIPTKGIFRLLGLVATCCLPWFICHGVLISLGSTVHSVHWCVLSYSWTVNLQAGTAFLPQVCISVVLNKAKMTRPFGAAGTQAITKHLKVCEGTFSSPKPAADIPFRDFSQIRLAQTAPFWCH